MSTLLNQRSFAYLLQNVRLSSFGHSPKEMPLSLVMIFRPVAHVLTSLQWPERLLSCISVRLKLGNREKMSLMSLIGLMWKSTLNIVVLRAFWGRGTRCPVVKKNMHANVSAKRSDDILLIPISKCATTLSFHRVRCSGSPLLRTVHLLRTYMCTHIVRMYA